MKMEKNIEKFIELGLLEIHLMKLQKNCKQVNKV